MLGSAADGRTRPPFGLSFSAGRGLVTLRRHAVAGLVRVESLEMEIPDLRFPFDVSGGARHFRHRRCALRRCELAVSEQELERWLDARLQAARLQGAAYSYQQLRLRLRHDHFELSGAVAVGTDAADFVARGVVMPTEGRGLAIGLSEIRVYGAFPVPAPLVAAGLLRGAGATPPAERDGRDTAGPLLVGCCDVELDPLGLALLHVLPVSGWRLPSMRVQLCDIDMSPGELRLRYRADGVEASDDEAPEHSRVVGGNVPARFVAAQEARRLFAQAERLIESGEVARAIDVYRRELAAHPQHPFIHQRLLQLLVASPDGDNEALEACRAAREALASVATGGDSSDGSTSAADSARRLGEHFAPATLCEAIVHARVGDARAAALFRQLAGRAAREQSPAEEVLALLAAGRADLAHDAARARADFERVLELSRDHAVALAELARLYAESEDWQRLVEVRKRQIGRARDTDERLAGHLALGEIFRVHLAEPEHAREQFDLALEIDEDCEPALQGLAEACIDAEDTLRAVRALDRLGELTGERDDREAEIAIHLRIASLWEHLGDREGALTRLRRARGLSPSDAQTLRRLATLLLGMNRVRDAVAMLRQLLDVTPDAAAQVALHRRLAELYRGLGDQGASEREIERALAVDPADPEALRLAIESAERRGEPEALADVLGRAANAEADQARRSQLLLRRGRLLTRAGRDTDALASFEAAASDASDDGWAARRELARLAAREERWEEARDAWRAALDTERGARDGDGWCELALIERRLGDLAAAKQALTSAAGATDNKDTRALSELAGVCADLGDDAGQRDALERLLLCLPEASANSTAFDDPQLASRAATHLRQLAELRAAAGQAQGALDLFERARALTPADNSLLWRLVELHEAEGELEAALPLFEALAARGSIAEQARASARLGRTLAALARTEAALAALERALELGVETSEADAAWRLCSELRLARGESALAAQALERSVTLLSDEQARAERLYQAAELWQKRASQSRQATRCYESALEAHAAHQGALDALEAIYGQAADVDALTRILRLKIERANNQPAQQTALLGRLAETLLDNGDADGARAAYQQALESDSRYVPALLFFARDARDRGDAERARRSYEAALEGLARVDVELGGVNGRTGALLECRVALAELCRAASDVDGEEQHLTQARRIAPDDARVLERLEALYAEQNRGGDQVELAAWRAARARDPREQRLLQRRHAALLYSVGKASDAADIYERLVAEQPGERGVLEDLARALRRTQRLPRLLEVLEQLVGLLDNVASAGPRAGEEQSSGARGQRDTTPDGLQSAERSDDEAQWSDQPTGPQPRQQDATHSGDDAAVAAVAVLVEAGQLALRLGQRERARRHLESALARRPDNIAALDSYVAMLRSDGSDDALERLEPILARRIARERHQARRIALTIERAELCERRGDLAQMAEVLDTAIDADDHDGELLLMAARVSEQLERWARAARAYELLRTTAIRPAEEKHAIRQLLRLVSGPLQSKRQLVALCQRLLALSPDDREALELLAAAHEERQEWAEAADALERLLDLLERHYGRVADQLEVTARLAHALRRAGRGNELPSVLAPALRKAGDERKHLGRLAALMAELDGGRRGASAERGVQPLPAAAADAVRALELASRRSLAQTRGGTMELLRVAELERTMGRPSEAAEALHEALTRLPPGPTRADVARDLLNNIDTEADADAALVALGVLEEEDASDEERWRLARLLADRDKPTQALALLSRIDPQSVDADALKSMRWLLLERTGNDIELAREVEAEARSHSEATARAKALLEAGQRWLHRARSTGDAARCVGDAARAVPDDIEALERAAHDLIAAGAGDMALELTHRLTGDERTFSPVQRAALCCMEARLRRDLGDAWENVRAAYERALAHDAHSAPALEGLIALAREQADRDRLADALARRAHGGGDARSRHAALVEAASLYARDLARPQDARPLLDEARRLAPDDENTLHLLAEVSLATGDSETTEQVLVALADLGREPERNLARACGLARLRGDRSAETRYLARLGDLRPESAQIKRRLANVYRDSGDLEGLRRQLAELADEDNQALFELARLYAGPLDDPLAAHDAFARLIARDERHRAAREELAQVCRELGFYRDVAEQLRSLIELEPAEAKARRGELFIELSVVYRQHLANDELAAEPLRQAMECFGPGQRWAEAARALLSLRGGVLGDDEATALRYELCRLGLARADELEAMARDAEAAGDAQRAEMALRRLCELEQQDSAGGSGHLERLAAILREREAHGELAELLEKLAARRAGAGAAELLLEAAERFRAASLAARAEGALRRAFEAAPSDDAVGDALLAHMRDKGDRAQLADALATVADSAGGARRASLLEQLAEVAESLGQSARAADARLAILELQPSRGDLLPALLERALHERDRERAQHLLSLARGGSSDDDAQMMLIARATARLAALELEAEQPRRAAELCEQAISLLESTPSGPADAHAALDLKRVIAERLGDNRAIADAQLAIADLLSDGEAQRDALRGAAAALRLVPDARDQCVEVHRRLCETAPEDHEARTALERLLRESDDPAQLVAFLWRSVGEREGDARIGQLLEIARIEQALGRPNWAERAYREALAESPGDTRALQGLAVNLQQREEWSQLVDLLQTALDESELEPTPRAELATMLGQTYLDQLDDAERGARWLREACEGSPHAEQALRRLLEHLRNNGDHRAAAQLIERTVRQRRDESVPGLWEELGHLLEVRLDDVTGAARAYQAAFEAAPDEQLARGVRAHELWADADRPEESLGVLGRVLPRVDASQRPGLELSRAQLLGRLGRTDEARRALERLLAQAPEGQVEAQAEAELGQLLCDAGDAHGALPHLVAAADRLAEATRAANAAVAAGEVLETLGLAADARERFEQALALDPALASAHAGIARQCRAMGQHERLASALQVLATLSDSADDRAGYLIERAELARAAGQNETALSAYQRAFEVLEAPAGIDEHLDRARQIAVELGRFETAAQLCARAIESARDDAVRGRLSRELGLLYAEHLDDAQAAAHHLEAALQLDADDERAAEALLPLLESTKRHGEVGRLAQRLAARRSGSARRALEYRAAKAYENAGWTDEARHLHRQLSAGSDDIARDSAARLLATEGGPPLARADGAVAEDGPRPARHTPPPVSLATRELRGDTGEHATTGSSGSGPISIADVADAELDTLARHGDFDALAIALRARARDTNDGKQRAALLLRLGHVLEELLDRPFEALEIYAEAAIAAPRSAAVLAALADAAYRHQDWQRARATYERLWQMDGKEKAGATLGRESRVELAFRRGVVHEAMGAYDAADLCYAQALELDDAYRPALETRARLALFRDDTESATQLLTRLSRLISVDDVDALIDVRERLGELHLRLGNLYTAREYLDAALALDARRTKAMQLMLATQEQLGRYDEAVELLQQLVYRSTDPLVRASLLHHRAELLGSHLGDEDAAVDCLLRAYDIAPNHVPTLWRLVDYYWSQNDLDAVVEIGEELAKSRAFSQTTPDRRHTRIAAAMQLARGRREAAEKLLSSALSEESLVEPSLIDLASIIARGAEESSIAQLVFAADREGYARRTAQRILRDNPSEPGLGRLVDALLNR